MDHPAKGSLQTYQLAAWNGRDQLAGPLVSRHHVCPKRHHFIILLLWHAHNISFLFSVMMVLVAGWGGGGGSGAWDGALFPHLPVEMEVGELCGCTTFSGFLSTMA